MITRTAAGTAINKSGAQLTLAINSIALQPGDLLTVCITYDVGEGEPVIKWGLRLCKPRITVAANGIVSRIVAMIYDGETARTRNLVATWTSTAPVAKAMCASVWTGDTPFGIRDVTASQGQALTTAPNSGTAIETTEDEEVLLAGFASEGPVSDTVGTVGNGWTSGQRAGTVGAPPVSNVTIHEAYKITSVSESAQASKTGATERDFSTVMCTFKFIKLAGKGISATDINNVGEIFEAANLDTEYMMFYYNKEIDRIEAYDVTNSPATLVAYHAPAGWVTV